jgi:hypothetical protein
LVQFSREQRVDYALPRIDYLDHRLANVWAQLMRAGVDELALTPARLWKSTAVVDAATTA